MSSVGEYDFMVLDHSSVNVSPVYLQYDTSVTVSPVYLQYDTSANCDEYSK